MFNPENNLSKHDLSAEGAALAAAFIDQATAGRVLEVITKDDLHPRHHRPLALLKALFQRDGRCDLVAAGAEAERYGLTFADISGLADLAPDGGALEIHIRQVKRLSKIRRAAAALVRAQVKVAEGPEAITEAVAALEDCASQDFDYDCALKGMDSIFGDVLSGARTLIGLPWMQMAIATAALLPGAVAILAGAPGSTKSFGVIQALRWWIASGVTASLLALEDGRAFHLRRAFAQEAAEARLTNDAWVKANPTVFRDLRATHDKTLRALANGIFAPENGARVTVEYLLGWLRRRAQAGDRVVVIDPVTAMSRSQKPWQDDFDFITGAKSIAERHNISIVLVSHPVKTPAGMNRKPTMDDLAGGACFTRLSHCILKLSCHSLQEVQVATTAGVVTVESNRTWACLKARNGIAEGSEYAAFFDPQSLTLRELGRRVD
jgi:hypothetical protein